MKSTGFTKVTGENMSLPNSSENSLMHQGLVGENGRLLSVHAHPDDESSKGAGTVARYVDSGVEAILVCCTGGEEGDVLNEALNLPEIRENMAEVRRQELAAAVEIIGFQMTYMLAYRDYGM